MHSLTRWPLTQPRLSVLQRCEDRLEHVMDILDICKASGADDLVNATPCEPLQDHAPEFLGGITQSCTCKYVFC